MQSTAPRARRLLSSSFSRQREPGRASADSRELLQALGTAFRTDPRPGLIFDFGRLVLANDAAKRLLRSGAASDAFLAALKAGLADGRRDPGLCLQTGGRTFQVELHHTRGRTGHWASICFLVRRPVSPAFRDLSEREIGVMTWLVRGLTNGEIGEQLGISIETVRKHVASALKKTGTHTRAALVGLPLAR
jgi:DNA-binding NarL/FixJ family response regulator